MLRSSLKLQLALGAMALALAMLALQSLAQFHVMREALTDRIALEQKTTVSDLARLLDEKLEDRVGALAQAALAQQDAPVSPNHLPELEARLQREAALLTLFDDLYIFDAKGILLVDWPVKPGRRTLDMSARDYIQGVIQSNKAFVSKPILGRATQQPIVVIGAPILDETGTLKGIMGGVLNLYKANLLGTLPNRKNGQTGYFYLVAPDRTLIAHPDQTRILKPAGAAGDNPWLDLALLAGNDAQLAETHEDINRTETFQRMKTTGWVLAAVLPAEEAFAPIAELRTRLVAMTLTLLLVSLPLLWVFADRMLKPLYRVADAMQDAAQRLRPGAEASSISVEGAREIRSVGRAFNDFLNARNQAEARLAASEHRLSLLVDHVSDGIWDWDLEQGTLFVNPAMRQMLGLTPLHTATLAELDRCLHPDDLATVQTARQACIRGQSNEFEREHRLLGADGHWLWVHTTAVVVGRHGDGTAARMLGTIVNVSSRKEQMEKLALAKADAEAASAAKSHFLANMSHEIRTPMNGVIGMTNLCLQTELNSTQREYLHMVSDSAQSLLSLIDDILDFSKIEAGKLELVLAPFSLQQWVTSTARNLSVRAEEKHLNLVLDVAPDLPTQVLGDKVRLGQVLINLVGNAIKFTEQGQVSIRMRQRPDLTQEPGQLNLEIQVSDTGIGIAPDKLAVIFEAFTQADATTTRQFGGTGLGLAISRNLAALMNGTLQAASVPGQGSTFTFTFCVTLLAEAEYPQPPEISATVSPAEPAPGTQALNVLVAEDNLVNQKLILALLRKLGHTVTVVPNGAEAVQATATQSFDLVLMDIQMPVMGGLEATQAIRQREQVQRQNHPTAAALRIVALTANALNGDREAFLAAGMDGYVSKPIAVADLVQEISRVMTAVTCPPDR